MRAGCVGVRCKFSWALYHYTIERELGVGGMTVVYLAKDEKSYAFMPRVVREGTN
jgi:serine/threonine protein kinase